MGGILIQIAPLPPSIPPSLLLPSLPPSSLYPPSVLLSSLCPPPSLAFICPFFSCPFFHLLLSFLLSFPSFPPSKMSENHVQSLKQVREGICSNSSMQRVAYSQLADTENCSMAFPAYCLGSNPYRQWWMVRLQLRPLKLRLHFIVFPEVSSTVSPNMLL